MQQNQNKKNFFSHSNREHGGLLSQNKRRSQRPLYIKNPVHIVLRSELAKGPRSLLKHKTTVRKVSLKASKKFQVQIYEKAICGNHLHLLVKAKSKRGLQNFFRVLAGHIAQEILRQFPITQDEAGGARYNMKNKRKTCKKNQRKFWDLLLYSRIVSWGRDFQNVCNYVIQNTLEVLKIIPYTPRRIWRWRRNNPGLKLEGRNTS